jgi:hypothetical protein
MTVENVTLVLDYNGKHLDNLVAYGYESYGDVHQAFVLDSTDCGPFTTDLELAQWLIKMLKLAHTTVMQ